MLTSKNKKRSRLIGVTAAVAIGIGAFAPQAKAFDLLQFASNVFGLGDLYTSANGLFSSASELYQNIQSLTSDIPAAITATIQGELGIIDPTKLFDEAVAAVAKQGTAENPISIGLEAGRTKALVAAATGSAPLTKQGQAKALEAAQQQTNLAEAATQSMTDTQNSTSSLEALQNGIGATNAISQQLKGISTQLLQGNQTTAAGVQVQEQIGREAVVSNINEEIKKDEQLNMVVKAGQVPMPMFILHK